MITRFFLNPHAKLSRLKWDGPPRKSSCFIGTLLSSFWHSVISKPGPAEIIQVPQCVDGKRRLHYLENITGGCSRWLTMSVIGFSTLANGQHIDWWPRCIFISIIFWFHNIISTAMSVHTLGLCDIMCISSYLHHEALSLSSVLSVYRVFLRTPRRDISQHPGIYKEGPKVPVRPRLCSRSWEFSYCSQVLWHLLIVPDQGRWR